MNLLKKENGDLKSKLENVGDFKQVREDLTQTRLDLATVSRGVYFTFFPPPKWGEKLR